MSTDPKSHSTVGAVAEMTRREALAAGWPVSFWETAVKVVHGPDALACLCNDTGDGEHESGCLYA